MGSSYVFGLFLSLGTLSLILTPFDRLGNFCWATEEDNLFHAIEELKERPFREQMEQIKRETGAELVFGQLLGILKNSNEEAKLKEALHTLALHFSTPELFQYFQHKAFELVYDPSLEDSEKERLLWAMGRAYTQLASKEQIPESEHSRHQENSFRVAQNSAEILALLLDFVEGQAPLGLRLRAIWTMAEISVSAPQAGALYKKRALALANLWDKGTVEGIILARSLRALALLGTMQFKGIWDLCHLQISDNDIHSLKEKQLEALRLAMHMLAQVEVSSHHRPENHPLMSYIYGEKTPVVHGKGRQWERPLIELYQLLKTCTYQGLSDAPFIGPRSHLVGLGGAVRGESYLWDGGAQGSYRREIHSPSEVQRYQRSWWRIKEILRAQLPHRAR